MDKPKGQNFFKRQPFQRGRPAGSLGQVSGRKVKRFDNKVISVRRVTRVVAGGRRFTFSAAVVVGDRKGRVGVGLGKGSDTAIAVEKASRYAEKKMITVPLSKNLSIRHETSAKYASVLINIRPAPGRGIIAGSAARTVFDLAGVTDISAKIISRSKNKLNIARATVKALSALA